MFVNGSESEQGKCFVEDLILHLRLPADRIVVEINGDIIGPECFGTHWLTGDEVVEIVSFVGGG